MIVADFAGYADVSSIKTTVSTRGVPFLARADGRALWNHCVGPFWADRDYFQFVKFAAQSLSRFRAEALDQTAFRVFLFHFGSAVSEEQAQTHVSDVADALARKARGPYALLAIDTCPRDSSPIKVKRLSPVVSLIRAPTPTKEYRIPDSKHYNTVEGVTFEFSIVSAIKSCISVWTTGENEACHVGA